MERGSWISVSSHQTSGKSSKPFRLRKKGFDRDAQGKQSGKVYRIKAAKHGGQKGTPKPEPRPARGNDQGIVRDERG
jgi:hypothetical protein